MIVLLENGSLKQKTILGYLYWTKAINLGQIWFALFILTRYYLAFSERHFLFWNDLMEKTSLKSYLK
jgi:hypothetical protein